MLVIIAIHLNNSSRVHLITSHNAVVTAGAKKWNAEGEAADTHAPSGSRATMSVRKRSAACGASGLRCPREATLTPLHPAPAPSVPVVPTHATSAEMMDKA